MIPRSAVNTNASYLASTRGIASSQIFSGADLILCDPRFRECSTQFSSKKFAMLLHPDPTIHDESRLSVAEDALNGQVDIVDIVNINSPTADFGGPPTVVPSSSRNFCAVIFRPPAIHTDPFQLPRAIFHTTLRQHIHVALGRSHTHTQCRLFSSAVVHAC